MGFGSYDESEQQQPDVDDDDDSEAVNLHDNEYEGEMSVDPGGSTTDLIGQLQTMKNDDEDEE